MKKNLLVEQLERNLTGHLRKVSATNANKVYRYKINSRTLEAYVVEYPKKLSNDKRFSIAVKVSPNERLPGGITWERTNKPKRLYWKIFNPKDNTKSQPNKKASEYLRQQFWTKVPALQEEYLKEHEQTFRYFQEHIGDYFEGACLWVEAVGVEPKRPLRLYQVIQQAYAPVRGRLTKEVNNNSSLNGCDGCVSWAGSGVDLKEAMEKDPLLKEVLMKGTLFYWSRGAFLSKREFKGRLVHF